MRRRMLVALVLVAAVGVFVVIRPVGGAASAESAAAEYVAALHARDRARLERLADPEHDAAAEITARLDRLGGGRLVVAHSSLAATESAFETAADLTGSVDGAPYTDRIWLDAHTAAWPHDGLRWFVALGPHRNS